MNTLYIAKGTQPSKTKVIERLRMKLEVCLTISLSHYLPLIIHCTILSFHALQYALYVTQNLSLAQPRPPLPYHAPTHPTCLFMIHSIMQHLMTYEHTLYCKGHTTMEPLTYTAMSHHAKPCPNTLTHVLPCPDTPNHVLLWSTL